jgi:hypothetical protein
VHRSDRLRWWLYFISSRPTNAKNPRGEHGDLGQDGKSLRKIRIIGWNGTGGYTETHVDRIAGDNQTVKNRLQSDLHHTSRIITAVGFIHKAAAEDDSLNMAGIVASLKVDTTLEVLCVNLDSPDARQSPDENNLAAIVFDLSNPPVHLDVTLLRDRPGLLLIGVDPSRDEMLVLSSHPAQALSMADLVNVIHQKEFTSGSFRGESHEMNHR